MTIKLTKTNKRHVIIYAASFCLPVVCLYAALAMVLGFDFAPQSLLTSDMGDQYLPFINDYWHRLRSGQLLPLWSWSLGGGVDYFLLFVYYLASPLNLLLVFIPNSYLIHAFVGMIFVKIGLAGLFMSIYLKYTHGRITYITPAISLCYCLCGFIQMYYFNTLWMDVFALMPLVVMGALAVMREGKFKLYIITLFLAVFTNYVFSFYVCIFVLLTFVGQVFILKLSGKETMVGLGKMALYSAIAIAMAGVFLVPSFHGVISATTTSPLLDDGFYHPFRYILSGAIAFSNSWAGFNMAYIYCGMGAVALLGLFFVSRRICLREKQVFLFTAAFIVFASNHSTLDYIFNGFHTPRGLFQRYSFLLAFLVATAAHRAIVSIKKIGPKELAAVAGVIVLFLFIAYDSPQAPHLLSNMAICGIYLLTLAIYAFGRDQNLSARKYLTGFTGVVFVGCILTEITITAWMNAGVFVIPGNEYPAQYEQVQKLLEMREDRQNIFYRTESAASFLRGNDPALYGFEGMSLYSSTANLNMTPFMQILGGSGGVTLYNHEETGPIFAMFTNLRYMISRDGKYADGGIFWQPEYEHNGAVLLENRYYLPLGFMTDSKIIDFEILPCLFTTQNNLFRLATGLKDDLFTFIEPDNEYFINYSAAKTEDGYYEYELIDNEEQPYLVWEYIMPKDGMLYGYMDQFGTIDITAGDYNRIQSVDLPHIFSAGHFAKGERVTIRATMQNRALGRFGPSLRSNGSVQLILCVIDEQLFADGYEILADEPLRLTKFTDTRIKGEVTVLQDGLLYISVPYNKFWTAYVNGKKAEIIPIGGAMTGVLLPAGQHTIELEYFNSHILVGLLISVCSGLAFVMLCVKKNRL